MARVFAFEPPERFVLGTVGEPGQRTFFLQAKQGERLVSVVIEKVQAQLLAERLDAMLDDVRQQGGADVPAVTPPELEDHAPLDTPIVEDFRARALTLSWHEAERVVVVEAYARAPDDDDDGEDEVEVDDDVLRVRLSPATARAFAQRALRVVGAGRPPCPLCGLPLDPQGHVCPRQNGHRG